MKKYIQSVAIFLLAALQSVVVFAQDKKEEDIDINTHKDNIWGQPWMWIVGAAVFILLLVAILKSGNRKSA